MTSDEARDLFSAAYDGELAGEERTGFDAALAADAELAAEYAELRKVLDEAHALAGDEDAPSPDLLGGVQNRIRARSRGRFYRDRFSEGAGPRAAMPLVIAAVMLLVVAVAWLALYYVEVEPPAGRPSAGSGAPASNAP